MRQPRGLLKHWGQVALRCGSHGGQPVVDHKASCPNVAQLQDDIQSGRTGDKAPGFDPAAAPLGTDDEAGGSPVQPTEVRAARAAERASKPQQARPNASEPSRAPDGGPSRGLGTLEVLWMLMLGLVGLTIFASIMIVSLG